MSIDWGQVKERLRLSASSVSNSRGERRLWISLHESIALADFFSISRRELEIAALEAAVIPERYFGNIGTLGLEGQIRLLRSRVALFGAGGLGGVVIELLARMGAGYLAVVDGDIFSSGNLNRQLHATESSLGENKAEAAASRACKINGAVDVRVYPCRVEPDSMPGILQGCHLAVDCLDNYISRAALEDHCRQLRIPMVHGAVAGNLGQIAVIRPERPLLKSIYGARNKSRPARGIEDMLGYTATAPAMVAAWQANEAVKILAGLEGVLFDRLMIVDMISARTCLFDL